MTEAQWLACDDPFRMLKALRRPSARKTRLLVCAAARRLWPLLHDARGRIAVEVGERFADGEATKEQREASASAACTAEWEVTTGPDGTGYAMLTAIGAVYPTLPKHQVELALAQARHAVLNSTGDQNAFEAEGIAHAGLFCDIFGNPFRPVALDPTWLTPDVLALARGIYDEKAFDRMPILADALQDAGCNNDDVLKHCRLNPVHVRGCWVVDLVLNKA